MSILNRVIEENANTVVWYFASLRA